MREVESHIDVDVDVNVDAEMERVVEMQRMVEHPEPAGIVHGKGSRWRFG